MTAWGLIPDKEAAKSVLHALLEREPCIPSMSERKDEEAAAEVDLALLNAKKLPLPLEKQLRERMEKFKRPRKPRS